MTDLLQKIRALARPAIPLPCGNADQFVRLSDLKKLVEGKVAPDAEFAAFAAFESWCRQSQEFNAAHMRRGWTGALRYMAGSSTASKPPAYCLTCGAFLCECEEVKGE